MGKPGKVPSKSLFIRWSVLSDSESQTRLDLLIIKLDERDFPLVTITEIRGDADAGKEPLIPVPPIEF